MVVGMKAFQTLIVGEGSSNRNEYALLSMHVENVRETIEQEQNI